MTQDNSIEVPPVQLHTIGDIVEHLNEPQHKIQYIIRSRGITPVAMAGSVRVFSHTSVERIRGELKRIREDRYGPDDEDPAEDALDTESNHA